LNIQTTETTPLATVGGIQLDGIKVLGRFLTIFPLIVYSSKLKGGGHKMESIALSEIESLDTMLNRYTEYFDLDELNEDEDHQILYDRVSDAYSKVKPDPATVALEKLKSIAEEEKQAIHDLIEMLIEIFTGAGITSEEVLQFSNLCRFYKRLVPTWIAPKALRIELR
jgi:hypothetical protein